MTMKIKIGSKELKFKIPIVVKFDEINYHSFSPALKGLHSDGDTEEEALKNAKATAEEFIKIMIEDGIPIPISAVIYDKKPGQATVAEPGFYEEEIVIHLQ
jgi:predicted RNase H-like HicB family nuclease